MAHIRTVVEVIKDVFNEDGLPIDVEGIPLGDKKKDQVPQTTTELYYLLHWGLQVTMIYDKEQNPIPLTTTVGICQHIKAGFIETFLPNRLKVIGVEK